MIGVKRAGQWNEARAALKGLSVRARKAEMKATLQEGHYFRGKVIKCFDSSGASNNVSWTPNAPAVIASKGSSKPLIDTADLRNSVTVVQEAPVVFVGVPSKKRRRDGGPLVSIAEVHEYGKIIVIPVTPKMLAFLHARRKELGDPPSSGAGGIVGGVLYIELKPRSFLQSTADAHYSNRTVLRDRYLRRLAVLMGPGWAVQAKGAS